MRDRGVCDRMSLETSVRKQICKLLTRYGITLKEVGCSSAMLLLSVNEGTEVVQRVAKWFYPSTGERYFTYRSPGGPGGPGGSRIEEYFILVMFESEPTVYPASFGIIKENDSCCDVWTYESKHPDVKRVESTPGYIVEIASIEHDKPTDLGDFREAKHIEGKFLQRKRNIQHYYPKRANHGGNIFLQQVMEIHTRNE